MRKFMWLLLMLLIAGCGGGGGSSTSHGGATDGSGSGFVTIEFTRPAKSALEKRLAAMPAPQEAGRVRVVLSSPSLHFKKIVDVAFGDSANLTNIFLPAAADYQVKAVFYADGPVKELTDFGAATTALNTGSATTVVVNMDPIAISAPHPASMASGATIALTDIAEATLAGKGLQANWSVTSSINAFNTRVHLAQSQPTVAHTVTVPIVSDAKPLYFQSEFFIHGDFVKEGEVPTAWTFVVASQANITGDSVSFPLNSALMLDDQVPVITSLSAPSLSASSTIGPLTITATDNAGIAFYKVTDSSDPTVGTWVPWADMPNPLTYTTTATVSTTDQEITFYAHVKDFAGNVAVPVSKKVVLNNRPAVVSFSVPSRTLYSTTAINVTVAGVAYAPATSTLKYAVTETNTAPTLEADWKDTSTIAVNLSFVPAPGVRYTVPLYAWVRDSAGNPSQSVRNTVTICDAPQILSVTAGNVATGSTVSISNFTAEAAPGTNAAGDPSAVNGYLITTTNAKPELTASWSATPVTSFIYPGLAASVATTKPIYAWVKDNSDRISLAKIMYVRFSNP